MKVRLEPYEFSEGLAETYENAARKAGLEVDDKSQYDCRFICVAENIQDTWIQYYDGLIRKRNPYISDEDIKLNVSAILLMSGAKVEKDLDENEVRLEDGFLVRN